MIDPDFLADSKKKIDAAKAALDNEKSVVWPFLKNLLEAYGNVSDESSEFNIEYANMLDEVELETDDDSIFIEYFPRDYEEIIDYSFRPVLDNLNEKYLTIFVFTNQEGERCKEEIQIPVEYASEKGIENLKEIYAKRTKQLEEYKNKKKTEKANRHLEKKKQQYEKLKKELGL